MEPKGYPRWSRGHVLVEIVAKASKQAMKIFKFRVPLDCEWKSEINWKETH